MDRCTGYPRAPVNRAPPSVMRERWCVTIQWDDEGDYTSPPIGPFNSESDARRFTTLARKWLRANGRKAQGRVKVHRLVHPEVALTWSALRGARGRPG